MIFRRALIRLTVTYTLVQLVLFGAFALGVYGFVVGTFDFDLAQLDGDSAVSAAERGFATLRMTLIVGYIILGVLLPIASYLMARAALAPIRRSYELQERFVDGASHELRSPLSVIQGELELALTRTRTAAQYQAAIANALDGAEGLTRLTNDLLLLTRGSTGQLQRTFESVALDDLVRRCVSAHPAPSSRFFLDDVQPVVVNGSTELLTRAIANIVDNAVKFSPALSRIAISVGVEGANALVRVHDEGVGMTGAEAQRAFDRFWRARDARDLPGFGLGLSIVRQICVAHGGRVSIVSQPGAGTTVTLAFPQRG